MHRQVLEAYTYEQLFKGEVSDQCRNAMCDDTKPAFYLKEQVDTYIDNLTRELRK